MRHELSAMLRLAWPVVLAELGWMSMTVVDTIIVGPLGPAAIGAVGTGANIFFAVIFLGMGTLLALDTFVAQNFGGGPNWSSFQINATKRLSNRWQLITGFEWDKTNTAPPHDIDPNQLLWEGGAHYTSWGFKVLGTYELPRGVQISGTYESQKGAPYSRTVRQVE